MNYFDFGKPLTVGCKIAILQKLPTAMTQRNGSPRRSGAIGKSARWAGRIAAVTNPL